MVDIFERKMTEVFKVSFEYVNPIQHPEYYHGDHPISRCVPPQDCNPPDECWRYVEKEGFYESVSAQYEGLIKQVNEGELIRNVKRYKGIRTKPDWQEI